MCKYQKVRGARAVLGILAIVVIVMLLVGCNSNQPTTTTTDSPAISTQAPISDQSLIDQQLPPADASGSDAEDQTDLPYITDLTYWRLVRQGKAKVIPSTTEYFDPNDPNYREAWSGSYSEGDLAAYPTIDVTEFSDESLRCYNINTNDVSPGTVISRLHCPGADYVVSMPVIPDELIALAESRGDSYCMLYTVKNDGSVEADLYFYQGDIRLFTAQGKYGVFLDIFRASCITWRMISSSLDLTDHAEARQTQWDGISVTYDAPGQLNYSDGNDRIYEFFTENPEDWNAADKDNYHSTKNLAQFTETTYTPSTDQLARIQTLLAEFEAQPLPAEYLE